MVVFIPDFQLHALLTNYLIVEARFQAIFSYVQKENVVEFTPGNPQALLKEAVNWLKSNLPKLIEDLAAEMAVATELPIHRLPTFLRKAVAKDMLQDLIKRFESNSFEAEAVQKKMVDALKKGATLKSMVTSVDLMTKVITSKATQELNDLPAVRNTLLAKTEYFATLIKSTIATAAIEYEKVKMNKLKIK